MKKLLSILSVLVLTIVLFGCGGSQDKAETKTIKVGVTAGPQAEVMDFVAKEAAKQNLIIEVIEFNDYVQPNISLQQKDLDINSFQHKPYLDNFNKDKGTDLVSIGKSILLPMAVYSNTYKSLDEIPDGAKISLPNDPTNGARALLLLEQGGLITLKDSTNLLSALPDIASNPKNFEFIELDAAQIPRSLDDVDLAVINTNYAIATGLNPVKDSLLLESHNSPYGNLIAVRRGDEEVPVYKEFVKIYQADATRKFVENHFKGTIITSF